MAFRGSTNDEMLRAWDPHAHALTVISEPHRMIHDGFYFDSSGIEASVASAANFDILIKLPAGTIGHLVIVEFALADAPCDIFFYKNVVTSADGAAANLQNHNQVSSNTSTAAVFTGPTVTDIGDLLHSRFIPAAGSAGNQPAGTLVAGEDSEWVIGSPSAATEYVWRVTNNSGGAIKLGWHINGYQIGYEA